MKAIEKELKRIEKAEERLCRRAEKKTAPIWKEKLEEKIPDKVMWGLQKMFSKAFFLIFEKGGMIIEKSYDKEALEKEFQVKDYAVGLKGGRKEIRNLKEMQPEEIRRVHCYYGRRDCAGASWNRAAGYCDLGRCPASWGL